MKEDDEEEVGAGWEVVVTEKARGQIIKSVRLLATSSNLKELINAAGQACGSANQLSHQCLAMPMPSSQNDKKETERAKGRLRRGGEGREGRGHGWESGLM